MAYCVCVCVCVYVCVVCSRQLWRDVKDFFTRLFDPDISQGAKDYYTAMFIFDILCFITIVAGVNSFGVSFCASNW